MNQSIVSGERILRRDRLQQGVQVRTILSQRKNRQTVRKRVTRTLQFCHREIYKKYQKIQCLQGIPPLLHLSIDAMCFLRENTLFLNIHIARTCNLYFHTKI